MKKEETLLAAYRRPIKMKLIDSLDVIKLKVNRIAQTKFTSNKNPIQLLKEMPALKIANKGFYTNAKVKLKVNTKFEFASTEEMLKKQSEFMTALVDGNKQQIRDIAFRKLNDKYKRREEKAASRKNGNSAFSQNTIAYLQSNKAIILFMLIPLILLIILYAILI